MVRALIFAAFFSVPLSIASAAEMQGVSLPDARMVDGRQMHLNGIGLRTYSVFGIRIYVAGLYLERPSGDPNAILHSHEHKLLDIHFLRDVDAMDARQSWQHLLEENCKSPCYLDPRDVQRFLAAVPSVHKGDDSTLLFTSNGVAVTLNGRPLGEITDPNFAVTMLATFIGSVPATPQLKRELLGFGD
jgi:hypothetical protein